ncbi:hypothetical protein [Oceanospirillum sediminis]|uniref:Uncharacterized protein n=1 Tax=Oceanospirillum sediminis TaxID=2760088 RepID=A0A839ISU9_9GAMM|nr:hypothetical protein [Oceanospirillum sediminis]MBB1488395.1 hypothetical protein [Oceanospirillum sediminis]
MAESSCSKADIRQVHQLRQKIRHAQEPDNPGLIYQWIQADNALAGYQTEQRRQHCIHQFQLLMDVVSDDYLPVHWRNTCLDSVSIPLCTLKCLADDTQSVTRVRQLFSELRTLSHYFQHSLSCYDQHYS